MGCQPATMVIHFAATCIGPCPSFAVAGRKKGQEGWMGRRAFPAPQPGRCPSWRSPEPSQRLLAEAGPARQYEHAHAAGLSPPSLGRASPVLPLRTPRPPQFQVMELMEGLAIPRPSLRGALKSRDGEKPRSRVWSRRGADVPTEGIAVNEPTASSPRPSPPGEEREAFQRALESAGASNLSGEPPVAPSSARNERREGSLP